MDELGLSLCNSINNRRVYEIGKFQRKNIFASFLHRQVWHAHFEQGKCTHMYTAVGSSILDSFREWFFDCSLYVFSRQHIVFCETEMKTDHQWVQEKVNLNIIRVLQLRATNTSSGSRKQILERHWIQRRVGGPRSERRRTEQLPGSMQQDERRSSGRVAQTPALATFRLSVLFCFTLYRVPTSVRQCLINQVWDTH